MKRKIVTLIMAGLFVLVAGTHAFADVVANPSRVADLKLLEMVIGDEEWVLIDCRPKKAYDVGHIPQSISLGDTCTRILLGPDLRPRPVAELEKILGAAGVTAESNVVFYADTPNMSSALVGLWVMGYLAHERVQFFNVDTWVAAGLPMVKLVPEVEPTVYRAATRR